MSSNPLYHLGCPAWSIAGWKGNFLPPKAPGSEFLALYSRVFNTVEGNSTFYALPKMETAQKWAESVEPGFEFCFKVPRDISHGHSLGDAADVFSEFLSFLEIFIEAKTLGPTFLQLHKSFGPDRLHELKTFSENWPKRFPLAVEVRHPEFFTKGTAEQSLNGFLAQEKHDRVIFDSGALYQAPPDDPVEAASQRRKPRLPVRWENTGRRPFLRLVGRNQIAKAEPWLETAAEQAAIWIQNGLKPYLFMHAPDDRFAHLLCQRFHLHLQKHLPGLPDLDWNAPHRGQAEQMELF